MSQNPGVHIYLQVLLLFSMTMTRYIPLRMLWPLQQWFMKRNNDMDIKQLIFVQWLLPYMQGMWITILPWFFHSDYM